MICIEIHIAKLWKFPLRSVNIYLDKIVFPYLLHPVLQVRNGLIAYSLKKKKKKEGQIRS